MSAQRGFTHRKEGDDMSIEIALLISIISVVFSVFSSVMTLKRNKSSDDKQEATDMTTLIVKLDGISRDVMEIKSDIKSVREDVKQNTEKIIRMEESLKSAWKAINKLQGGKGCDE